MRAMALSGDSSSRPEQAPGRAAAEDSFRQGEDHPRRAVDTTPAQIHTARPHDYVDFRNHCN